MNVVVYPVPNESEEVWDIFKPCVQRFIAGWWQFPPEEECELVPVLFNWDHTGKVTNLFEGLPVQEFPLYRGLGADLGAQQFVAMEYCQPEDFVVCFTSRMFFHRSGWLKRLVNARSEFGPALYGMSASHEGGRKHLCTRGHALDAADFRRYPHVITSRDQGVFFECGEGCLLEWMKSIGRSAYLVSWAGVFAEPDWFSFPNRFRHGDQTNLLCFDKHSEAYHRASDQERARLAEMSEPPNKVAQSSSKE